MEILVRPSCHSPVSVLRAVDKTLANDDGYFRYLPQCEVRGMNDANRASKKACRVPLKSHFENANGHITDGV